MKNILSLLIIAALTLGCEVDKYPGADEFAPGQGNGQKPDTEKPEGPGQENPEDPNNPGGEDPETPVDPNPDQPDDPNPDQPDDPNPDQPDDPNPDQPDDPTEGWNYAPVTTATIGHAGISYIWDESVIPEITITITKDEWNNFLAAYDRNANNKEYFPCDITYKKGSETHTLYGAGVHSPGR